MTTLTLSQSLVQAQVSPRQTAIARSYREFKERKLVTAQKCKVRISLSHGLSPVQLSGSFTDPPWEVAEQLRYSLASNELFAVVWLTPGDTFQLKKREEVILHPEFPVVLVRTRQVENIGSANVFTPETSPKASLSRNRDSGFHFNTGVFTKGKSRDTNEDAYFHKSTAVGLADGVSAWRRYGLDGGQFARELMHHCSQLQLLPNASRKDLAAALKEAHAKVQAYGSSTALLGFLVDSHLLLSALGDSRAMLVRWSSGRPAIVFKTGVSVHSFNTPYQLANVPKNLHHVPFVQDTAADALHYCLEVEPGDLLIIGSDGLWDNLYDWEIVNLLGSNPTAAPKGIAEVIGQQAYMNSKAETAGPFQDAVHQVYPGVQWRGGKVDDITVLAARLSL